jgi:chromosomal replication initiation ATPase DnaA
MAELNGRLFLQDVNEKINNQIGKHLGSKVMEQIMKCFNLHTISSDEEPIVDVNTFVDKCCESFGVSRKQLLKKVRTRELCYMRYSIMYYMMYKYGMTMVQIRDFFGFENHTTIVHAKKTLAALLETNDVAFAPYFQKTSKQFETLIPII